MKSAAPPPSTPLMLRVIGVLLSVAMFAAACALPMVYSESGSPYLGIWALIFGALAALQDRFDWHIGWYANLPLLLSYVTTLAGLPERRFWPVVVSALAVAIALTSFFTLDAAELPMRLRGTLRVARFGPGLYLWFGSILWAFVLQLSIWRRGLGGRGAKPA